jgi:hypothetical protein
MVTVSRLGFILPGVFPPGSVIYSFSTVTWCPFVRSRYWVSPDSHPRSLGQLLASTFSVH